MSASILVVEGNAENRKLVTWALSDAGYDFSAVDSAEKALALLEREIYDLVLLDISLPGMDGKETARRLRGDARFASLPIIAVTAHASKEEERTIRKCGVTAMEREPIDEVRLIRTIEEILRQVAQASSL